MCKPAPMANGMAKRKRTGPPLAELARLEALLGEGMAASVLREAASIARKQPRSAALQIILGAANMRLAQFEDAAKAFARATQIDPRYAAAWNNLGLALKEQGKHDEAIMALRRACRANPALAAAHYNLGNLLRESGAPAEAVGRDALAKCAFAAPVRGMRGRREGSDRDSRKGSGPHATMSGPLAGLRVLDIATIIAAPSAAALLGDLLMEA